MSSWSGGLAEWIDGNTAYVSAVFSWNAEKAYMRCIWLKSAGYHVKCGGQAVAMNADIFSEFDTSGSVNALPHHNPDATFASRGCPMGCYFCIVPKMEGTKFTFIPDFTPRPILCDNNVSALPDDYQDHIIERYKKFNVRLDDINSGFEPHSFDESTYARWKPFYHGAWRFAFDEMKEEVQVKRMIEILASEPAGKKRVYVLIGNEPFEQCYERITKVIEWGCEPHVQPMIPLGALTKKPIIQFDWTEQKLKDLARWANRWIWRTVKFEDYSTNYKNKQEQKCTNE